MQSFSDVLNRLHEAAGWFARAQEVRLLVVRTSPEVRKAVLKLLPTFEFHADNRSPWVVLEDARTAEDDGWQARANGLAADWERRRQAFAKEGVALSAVTARAPLAQAAPARGLLWNSAPLPLARVSAFLLTTVDVGRAIREPLRGIVLVLAPGAVDDAAAFDEELDAVLRSPLVAFARIVLVIDADVEPPCRALRALGEGAALSCDARMEPGALDRDVEAMLGGGEGGPRAATGAAGPRGAAPPRRVDDPPEMPKEERDRVLGEAGVDPRYLDEAPRLGRLVLGAALAMKQRRAKDAMRLQREAVDLCAALELHLVKVICQMALASYLSGSGDGDGAVRELEGAARHAAEHGLGPQQSQALLALGLVHAVARRYGEATRAYADSARAAERAGIPVLAIEAWRLAGQLAAEKRALSAAATCFREALRVAGAMPAAEASATSAAEAARALGALCRKNGLAAQAESLEAQAAAIDRGEPPAAGARAAP